MIYLHRKLVNVKKDSPCFVCGRNNGKPAVAVRNISSASGNERVVCADCWFTINSLFIFLKRVRNGHKVRDFIRKSIDGRIVKF